MQKKALPHATMQGLATSPGGQPGKTAAAKPTSLARRAPSPPGGKAPAFGRSPAKGLANGTKAVSGKAVSPGHGSLAAAKGMLAKIASVCVLPFAAANGAAGVSLIGFVQLTCMSINTAGVEHRNGDKLSNARLLLLFHGTCQ